MAAPAAYLAPCSRLVDRRFNAADESCSDPASAVYLGVGARYYFLATFEARTWRSSPSIGRLVVFLEFLDFLEVMETSEVAGPGPNPREIEISFGADGPLACARPTRPPAAALLVRRQVVPVLKYYFSYLYIR